MVVSGLVQGLLEDVGWVVGEVVDVLSLFMNGEQMSQNKGEQLSQNGGTRCPKIGGSNCPKIGGSKCPESKCPKKFRHKRRNLREFLFTDLGVLLRLTPL